MQCRTQRHCYKTVIVGGVTIPEGADAFFPLNVIHHMPQYWPNPHKFDPERQVVAKLYRVYIDKQEQHR